MRSPNWETVSPAQKRVNRRSRHNDDVYSHVLSEVRLILITSVALDP
ncbi:hypothetical protein SAMN05216483_3875 [Streptomyces sp. 2131.1]|nr:hypothetical protein SAMN05216483_3875 [Streptomyces sp. 2131.1]